MNLNTLHSLGQLCAGHFLDVPLFRLQRLADGAVVTTLAGDVRLTRGVRGYIGACGALAVATATCPRRVSLEKHALALHRAGLLFDSSACESSAIFHADVMAYVASFPPEGSVEEFIPDYAHGIAAYVKMNLGIQAGLSVDLGAGGPVTFMLPVSGAL